MLKIISGNFAQILLLFCLQVSVYAQSTSKASLVPSITIVTNDAIFSENIGALCFNVQINNPVNDTTKVDVVIAPGNTGSLNSDFTFSPATIRFAPNFSGNESVCMIIIDDAIAETIETYRLKITNPTNAAVLVDSLINITVYDDDSVSTGSPCADLFFSEFVHSFTSNDRGLEIYNPSGALVDLSNYSLKFYYSGNTVAGNELQLSGFLNHGETFTICASSSDSLLRILADTVDPQFFYNGGDVIGLYHNSTLIDCFGIIGVNPGQFWPTGTGNTTSSTLVRKQNIKQGESSWAISNGQWNVFPQGDYSHFGSHTINGCGFVVPPTVTMFTADASFPESVGGLGISAKLYNPGALPITVDVVLGSNTTASNNIDFSYSPTQLVFPAGVSSSQYITININDELVVEPDELVELRLTNASNGASILDSVWRLTIVNDDFTAIRKVQNDAEIVLQPNPVKDVLTIKSRKNFESYEIANLLGQVNLHGTILSNGTYQISTETLVSGSYLLRLKSKDGWRTMRFSKE